MTAHSSKQLGIPSLRRCSAVPAMAKQLPPSSTPLPPTYQPPAHSLEPILLRSVTLHLPPPPAPPSRVFQVSSLVRKAKQCRRPLPSCAIAIAAGARIQEAGPIHPIAWRWMEIERFSWRPVVRTQFANCDGLDRRSHGDWWVGPHRTTMILAPEEDWPIEERDVAGG